MASMGALVVNLVANTRQFDSAVRRSQHALQSFAAGAKQTTEAVHALETLTISRQAPQQLDAVAKTMGDLEITTRAAAEQVARFEQIAHQASAVTSLTTTSLTALGGSGTLVAKGAATASHGMHSVVIGAIAVRRTLQSAAWAMGVMADGVRVLLAPFRLLFRALQMLLAPFKVLASMFAALGRGILIVVSPLVGLAGAVFKAFIYFKALQLQVKLTRAILDLLPPRVKAVAAVLFGLGLASRAGQFALERLGAAGRMLGAALRALAAPIRALFSPLQTLEKIAAKTAATIRAFVSSALGPLSLAFSGLGAVAAAGGMVKLAADAETLALQMEVLTKDAGVARKLVQDLNAFSAQVPFDKMDLKQAATQLLAVQTPVSEIISDMTVLANLAAGSGVAITELTDIFAQLRSTGTVTMQDLQVLQRRNINLVPLLTKQFGNLEKATQDGRVSFDDLRAAMYAVTTGTGTFAGMVERLSKSFSGQFSTLKNNIIIAATALGEQMLPALTKGLDTINGMIAAFAVIPDKAQFIGEVFDAAFTVAFENIKIKFSELLDWLQNKGASKAADIAGAVAMAIPNFIGNKIGEAVRRNNPNALPIPAPRKPADLAAAELRLQGLLDQLKPRAVPAPQPNPNVLQRADNGQALTAAVAGMIERMRGTAGPIVDAVAMWAGGKLVQGMAVANQFSGLLGGDAAEKQQTEKQFVGALQAGSADAYSAIVQAMSARQDPVVAATKKQTQELKKPLFDIAAAVKGAFGDVIENFAGAQ